MTSTSPQQPARPPSGQGAGSISQLQARVSAQTEADQRALTQAALEQMTQMSIRMQAALDDHVSDWRRRVSVAFDTMQRDIALDLTAIRSSVSRASAARWRWMIWMPVASVSVSALVLVLAMWLTHSWLDGIAATEIDRQGQTMQVLTGSDWTICRWQGEKHPCRPVVPKKE